MKILRFFPGGKLFGALSRASEGSLPEIANFLPDSAMASVVSAYQKDDKRDWRVHHLPLVVGRTGRDFLKEIREISLKDSLPDHQPLVLGGDIRPSSLSTVASCRKHLRQEMKKDEEGLQLSQGEDLQKFLGICARLMCSVASRDAVWFGSQSSIYFLLEYRLTDHIHGRHNQTGDWHRDNGTWPENDAQRIYVFRDSFPMFYVRNKHTELYAGRRSGLYGKDMARLQSSGHCQRLRKGEICLMNGGTRGTLHRTYRPKPYEAAGFSLFGRMNISP